MAPAPNSELIIGRATFTPEIIKGVANEIIVTATRAARRAALSVMNILQCGRGQEREAALDTASHGKTIARARPAGKQSQSTSRGPLTEALAHARFDAAGDLGRCPGNGAATVYAGWRSLREHTTCMR